MKDHPDNCPKCGISFIGEEVPAGLFSTGHYPDMDSAKEAAKHYGWTEENKITFSANCVFVKHLNNKNPNYYKCTSCDHSLI